MVGLFLAPSICFITANSFQGNKLCDSTFNDQRDSDSVGAVSRNTNRFPLNESWGNVVLELLVLIIEIARFSSIELSAGP